MSWPGPSRLASVLLAAAAIVAAGAGSAAAVSLAPPKPDVLFGVSDRGTTEDFDALAGLVGKHPALLETFHPWGNNLNGAYERWREYNAGLFPPLPPSSGKTP